MQRTVQRAGAILMLTLVLTVVAFAILQYRAAKDRYSADALRSAHVVATQFEWMLQTSAQALQRIEDAVGDVEPRLGDREISNILDAVRDLPAGFHYGVYDARGDLRYSSLSRPIQVNVGDREYFRQLETGSELVVSPQVTDRQSGEKAFIVARRLDRGDRFIGVATIAIPQTALKSLSEALGQTDDSTISLVREDGMLIARSLAIEPMDLSGTPLFEEWAKHPNGSYDTVSPADHIARVVGYWTMDGWPVIAVAGISHSLAYGGLVRGWLVTAALTLPLVVYFCIYLFRLNHRFAREERDRRALAEANQRSQFLLREIHHRVKNNLQTVISLIRLERISPDVKSRLLARIVTMVEVHEEMYKSDQPEWINLQTYVPHLVNRIAASNLVPVKLDVRIAPVIMPGGRAMILGLMLNELVTNACKHAFAGVAEPLLEVTIEPDEPGWLRLVVCDNGPGYQRDQVQDGMRLQLIEAFADQLGGRLTQDTEGRVCTTVHFPVTVPD